MSTPPSSSRTHGPAPDETAGPVITVLLQPENKEFAMPRAKTARQLLERLGLRPGTALVIREETLLTPDRRIYADERITVRVVTSRG
ncbi:MAG: hypothetical protein LBH65_01885 [Desulfovibrio sp.]|jgi:sulfur carrier protein|nr:hypothetical protein [Desulfovibrio sp.]